MAKFFYYYKTCQIILAICCILFLSSVNELCGTQQMALIPVRDVLDTPFEMEYAFELGPPPLSNGTMDHGFKIVKIDNRNDTIFLKRFNETMNDSKAAMADDLKQMDGKQVTTPKVSVENVSAAAAVADLELKAPPSNATLDVLVYQEAKLLKSLNETLNDLQVDNKSLVTNPPVVTPAKVPEPITRGSRHAESTVSPSVEIPVLKSVKEIHDDPPVIQALKEVREEPIIKLPSTTTSGEQPAPEEQKDVGFLATILGIFGGGSSNKRSKREAYDVHVQDRFYVQHCEKADDPIMTYMHPFSARNIYQQIFALRFWASIFLCIHLVMIIYHSLLNCFHRVPTSQRFNRAFAIIGLIIWNVISLWITYQYYAWDRNFVHALAPIVPRIPAEFVVVLILASAMNVILFYELFTPITYSITYDLAPRYHPRQGYVPAAQSENEYINGIIRQLEAAQNQPPPRLTKSRPLIRSSENLH